MSDSIKKISIGGETLVIGAKTAGEVTCNDEKTVEETLEEIKAELVKLNSNLRNIKSKTMTVNSGGMPFCTTKLDASKHIIVGISMTNIIYRPMHYVFNGEHGFIPLSNKDMSGNYEPIYVFNTDIEFTVYYIDLN